MEKSKTNNNLKSGNSKGSNPKSNSSKSGNAKTPMGERLHFAIEQLKKYNIEHSLKNEGSGHLHCRRKSDDKLIQFWAGTGKIMEYEERGIHNLIIILTK